MRLGLIREERECAYPCSGQSHRRYPSFCKKFSSSTCYIYLNIFLLSLGWRGVSHFSFLKTFSFKLKLSKALFRAPPFHPATHAGTSNNSLLSLLDMDMTAIELLSMSCRHLSSHVFSDVQSLMITCFH